MEEIFRHNLKHTVIRVSGQQTEKLIFQIHGKDALKPKLYS